MLPSVNKDFTYLLTYLLIRLLSMKIHLDSKGLTLELVGLGKGVVGLVSQ